MDLQVQPKPGCQKYPTEWPKFQDLGWRVLGLPYLNPKPQIPGFRVQGFGLRHVELLRRCSGSAGLVSAAGRREIRRFFVLGLQL